MKLMCTTVPYVGHRLGIHVLSRFCSSLLDTQNKVWSTNVTRGGRAKYCSRTGDQHEATTATDILQAWTKAVLKENTKNQANQASISGPQGGIKRPLSMPRAEGSPAEGNSKVEKQTEQKVKRNPGVFRRRMTDSSWTKTPMDDKLIWVDCEMTGLNLDTEMIMEIGCVITDSNLKEIAAQPSIIVHVPEEKLQAMGIWCVKHHGDSGLTEACRQSRVTSEEVDEQLLRFLQKYTTEGECPMAGNSIYMDRMFISKQFPKFHSHFHYRNVDVSTLKELVRRWYPSEYSQAPKKKFAHRVLDDIKDSIAELEYYRSNVFIKAVDENLSKDKI